MPKNSARRLFMIGVYVLVVWGVKFRSFCARKVRIAIFGAMMQCGSVLTMSNIYILSLYVYLDSNSRIRYDIYSIIGYKVFECFSMCVCLLVVYTTSPAQTIYTKRVWLHRGDTRFARMHPASTASTRYTMCLCLCMWRCVR